MINKKLLLFLPFFRLFVSAQKSCTNQSSTHSMLIYETENIYALVAVQFETMTNKNLSGYTFFSKNSLANRTGYDDYFQTVPLLTLCTCPRFIHRTIII